MDLPSRRGGWWHEYVCPVHGTELLPPSAPGEYPCPYGCLLTGEPYDGAWTVFAHHAAARQLRLAAYQERDDEALAILDHYVKLYAELEPGGHEGAKSWMVPGRLFHQALTEAIWTVSVADAVWELAGRVTADSLAPAVTLLRALRETAVLSRTMLANSGDLRNNYVAWFNAADALVLGAINQVTGEPPAYDVVTHLAEHAAAAVLADGWEWEGGTYYHQFVLRAHLLALKGRDPAALPTAFSTTLRRMTNVLAQIATTDGSLPQFHDSPYDRIPQTLEYLELAVLASQFAAGDELASIETWARSRLGDSHDGLEDHLDAWFAGNPLPAAGNLGRRSALFPDAGYAVLRAPGWSAIIDFGPHGGAHGHRDKLALYLYGTSAPWQPDYGVTPYGSSLRHDFYASTAAHPTFTIDGAEQQECSGRLVAWSVEGETVELCVETDEAYPGAVARRQLVMTPTYLLDVLLVDCSEPHLVTLQFRPGVPLDVSMTDARSFRTTWQGSEVLLGTHIASEDAVVRLRPGLGPADDPVRAHNHVDWQLDGRRSLFVSVYRLDGEVDVELGSGQIVVTVAGRRRTHEVAGW